MFLVASNKARRLLHLSYIGRVSVEELQKGSEELVALLSELPAGLQILVDLERLAAWMTRFNWSRACHKPSE